MRFFARGKGILLETAPSRKLILFFSTNNNTMKFLSMFLMLLAAGALKAQPAPEETAVPSKISRVTVFLQGAQILRQAEANIPSGKSVLVLKGLSPHLDPASIKVSATGNFTLLSVNHRRNFSEAREKSARVAALEQGILQVQDSMLLVKAHLQVLEEETKFLQANQTISGKDRAYSLAELRDISQFYATRMRQIQEEKLRMGKTLQDLEIRLKKLQAQIQEFQKAQAQVSGEVVLTVQAGAPVKGQFELSYLANGAGWFPEYDLKVRSVNDPIALIYKAGVYQNTGEDWNNVRLRFSNGNPKESGNIPNLQPFFLSPFTPRPAGVLLQSGAYNPLVRTVNGRVTDEQGEPIAGATVLVKGTNIGTVTDINGEYALSIPEGARQLIVTFIGYASQEAPVSRNQMDFQLGNANIQLEEVVVTGYARGGDARKMEKPAAPPPSTTLETATTVEFELQIPFTVPSDGEKYTVTLTELSLNARYEYQTIPKMEKTAYLSAYITDWEQYNLLEGEANLFFEDTYLGRSLLDTRFVSDTLKLSLGRDRGVSIDRQSVREFSRRGFAGGKKTDARSYRITVRNGKAQPITLVVKDQIPVSRNKEIEVLNAQYPGGEIDPETGIVTWTIQLAPGEQKELPLQYEVRYPREMILRIE